MYSTSLENVQENYTYFNLLFLLLNHTLTYGGKILKSVQGRYLVRLTVPKCLFCIFAAAGSSSFEK